jgi:hypothetical protein
LKLLVRAGSDEGPQGPGKLRLGYAASVCGWFIVACKEGDVFEAGKLDVTVPQGMLLWDVMSYRAEPLPA